MKIKKIRSKALLLNSITLTTLLTASVAAMAQDYSYVVHKPTGLKFHSCSSIDGSAVVAASAMDVSECVRWEQVPAGEYFFIRNWASGKNVRPASSENGSAIEIQPANWTGNWTQWSFEDRGDGFGHLVNRATGKYIFSGGNEGESLELQPSSWRGNYTQWAFEPADDPNVNEPWLAVANISGLDEGDAISLEWLDYSVTFTESGAQTFNLQLGDHPVGESFIFEVVENELPENINCTFNNNASIMSSSRMQSNTVNISCQREPVVRPSFPPNCEPEWTMAEFEGLPVSGAVETYRDTSASGNYGIILDEIGDAVELPAMRWGAIMDVVYASVEAGTISYRQSGGELQRLNLSGTGDMVDEYSRFGLNNLSGSNSQPIELVFTEGDIPIALDFVSQLGPFPPCPTPSPTPIPSGVPIAVYQAESGQLSGSARVYSDAAASLDSAVGFIDSEGDSIRFNSIPAATQLQFQYASEAQGQISLRVNDENIGDVVFTSTGDWTTRYESVSLDMDIPQGSALEIFYEAGDAPIHIDYLRVIPPMPTPTPMPTQTPLTIEAESAVLSGSASVFNDVEASEGQGVAYISQTGASVAFEPPASSRVDFRYASELSGEISMRVNGNDVGNLAFASTGNWVGQYAVVSADVTIPENSTFELFFDSGDAALNLDYLVFYPAEVCEEGYSLNDIGVCATPQGCEYPLIQVEHISGVRPPDGQSGITYTCEQECPVDPASGAAVSFGPGFCSIAYP